MFQTGWRIFKPHKTGAPNTNPTAAETEKTKSSPAHRKGNGKFIARGTRRASAKRGGRKSVRGAMQAGNSSRGTAARLMSQGRDAVGGAYSWAGQAAGNLKMPDMQSMRQMANERPLVLGAVGLGIGLLLGVLLPSTRSMMHMMPGQTARRRRR
ncbi:MAG: hypothetical protein U1E15_04320 [Hyphomicrobiales bacterium]